MMTRKGIVHSEEDKGIQDVTVTMYNNANDIQVVTPRGVRCTAIDNPFTGLLYCDDINGKLK